MRPYHAPLWRLSGVSDRVFAWVLPSLCVLVRQEIRGTSRFTRDVLSLRNQHFHWCSFAFSKLAACRCSDFCSTAGNWRAPLLNFEAACVAGGEFLLFSGESKWLRLLLLSTCESEVRGLRDSQRLARLLLARASCVCRF